MNDPMTARDVIAGLVAEMRAGFSNYPDEDRIDWADRLESTLTSSGEAVAWLIEWQDGTHLLTKHPPQSRVGEEGCVSVTPLTPPAPLGGLTEDALVEWACKEMHGTWDFPEAHSDGGKATLRDRMRRIIERARLTAPRAAGVDDAMVLEIVRQAKILSAEWPYEEGDDLRKAIAALTAAAPKVAAPQAEAGEDKPAAWISEDGLRDLHENDGQLIGIVGRMQTNLATIPLYRRPQPAAQGGDREEMTAEEYERAATFCEKTMPEHAAWCLRRARFLRSAAALAPQRKKGE